MKLSEFRQQIRDLGFEDDAIYSEYSTVILNALNRSLDIINTTVEPVVDKIEIIQDGTQSGMVRYDLSELCEDANGNKNFESLYGTATRIYNNAYSPFRNFTLEQNKIILMDASLIGTFTFFYTPIIADITTDTQDDFEIPIAHEVEQLLPHLTAYYVWLDDDERKAIYYRNNYDELKNEILEKIRAREEQGAAEIIGGIGWD